MLPTITVPLIAALQATFQQPLQQTEQEATSASHRTLRSAQDGQQPSLRPEDKLPRFCRLTRGLGCGAEGSGLGFKSFGMTVSCFKFVNLSESIAFASVRFFFRYLRLKHGHNNHRTTITGVDLSNVVASQANAVKILATAMQFLDSYSP